MTICSCYECLTPCLPGARPANIPKPLMRMQICRSRLAGERGGPGHECVAARSSSRASALLQVIGKTPASFGTCKIRQSGIPTAFGVRKICRSRRYWQRSACAISDDPGETASLRRKQKSVGADLLANAVNQATNALQQDRLRGQARSYR